MGTTERIDIVVIGAGQAGLCMSYYLQLNGQQHVVLERGRVGERWRSERWDSLRFQFESSIANLPGYPFSGKNKDAFMPRNDVVQILDELRCIHPSAHTFRGRSDWTGSWRKRAFSRSVR